jgi:energy-coupling factor transporter ATP-binding protein EcfA2
MTSTRALLSGIEVIGPEFRCSAHGLPTPLAILIGANGCGKTTLLKAVNATAAFGKLQHRQAIAAAAQRPLKDALRSLEDLGPHVDRINVTYSDGTTFSIEQNRHSRRKQPTTVTAKLQSKQGAELWSRVFTHGQAEKGEATFEEMKATPLQGEEQISDDLRAKYFSTDIDFVDTSRLNFSVPASESLIRKYGGVVFRRYEGPSADRLKDFLNMIAAEPRRPPRFPRVHVLAGQIGIAVDQISSAYKDAIAARDTRTVTALLRSPPGGDDLAPLAAKVYAEEERLQESLRRIGLAEMPRFVDISLERTLAERPPVAREYLRNSLISLNQLQLLVAPLAGFFREVERILTGCELRIRTEEELRGTPVFFPPGQTRKLVVRYAATGSDCELLTMSSGQQQMLVLLARIWLGRTPHKYAAGIEPRLLLIDEPEISMHLAWQHEIAQQFTKVVSQSETQVVAATHSNFVSGSLPPASVFEL